MQDLTIQFNSHYAKILEENPDHNLYEMVTQVWNDFMFDGMGNGLDGTTDDLHLYGLWFTELVERHEVKNAKEILGHLADLIESVSSRRRLYLELYPDGCESVKV